jgi:hypothetical protein
MMVDGVIPLGEAVRPLGLSGPSSQVAWRREQFGSRPRAIGRGVGCARITTLSGGRQCLLAELAQRVVAALEQLARDRQAGAVAAQALGGLPVVVAVR